MQMKRVMVIGCCGAGKSTLSKKLHRILKLPLIHLDRHYWKPKWTETPSEEWIPIVNELAAKESWIIDGNYGSTLDIRLARADTIIYLDYSTATCLYRVCSRAITNYGKTRSDMTAGCPERIDFKFFHYVATYNMLRRKAQLAKVKKVSHEKQCIILKNDREVKAFLDTISVSSKCQSF